MPCKTSSGQSSTEYLRLLCALPPTPLDLPNFNLNCEKNSFFEKLDFPEKKKKKTVLSQNNDFDGWPILSGNILLGGHFWKYKPPGGLPVTNPGFLETQISPKSQGLKTGWSFFLRFFKFVVKSSNVVALTFRCGSR